MQPIPLRKRLFDLTLTLLLLLPGLPLMAVIALILYLKEGKPVLFRQQRPGRGGKIFTLFKFRTMRNAFDRHDKPLPDGARLTRLGRFLRSTSLDELPELFNVLRGEMSLVGPRPLLVEYLPLYNPQQAHRHDVLPGITGWAQINGRNALTWEEKFRLDVWYVQHWSLRLDLKILTLTIWKVLRREGINAPGQDTAEPFAGSANPPE